MPFLLRLRMYWGLGLSRFWRGLNMINLSESEFTELKNFQNGFLAEFGFYSVNPKIL